ncbi:histone deacetylase [Saprospiraceae bacterium]|nr:histone deacetylase [Saprospiraceae bacterium]
MLKIAYSPIYKYQLPPGHRFPMMKYELIPEQLLYEGSIDENQFFHPDLLDEETILLTHTKGFWDKLQHQALSAKEIRKIGFPMLDSLVTRGRHISQGTIDCAEYALKFGCAMNIAGGTHHSFADRGEGFCVFNDFAITANYLLKHKIVTKILICDLDVHQGNGTAKIFENNQNVFTFSMHGAKNYPTKKEKSDLDIGLPDKTEDSFYLQTLEQNLSKLIDKVKPDIILYLSGVDVLETDKLGRLSMTLEGCKTRDSIVFQAAAKYQIPISVSMGGGYSTRLADIVDAHANTFRMAMQVFS